MIDESESAAPSQILRLKRTPGTRDGSLCQVRIDGQDVAALDVGDTTELTLPAGEHVLRVRTAEFSSGSVPIRVGSESLLEFVCYSADRPPVRLLDNWRQPTGYLYLRDIGNEFVAERAARRLLVVRLVVYQVAAFAVVGLVLGLTLASGVSTTTVAQSATGALAILALGMLLVPVRRR